MNLSNATVRGYKPFPSQRTPNGTITITAGTIDGGSDLEYEKTLPIEFEKDAQSIYDVLSNNLPGGTLHQLLIKMLQGKLNLFIVADKEDLICQDCGSRTIRALVAEQEQASAGDFSKAPILTPEILLGTSPPFSVGDKVRVDSVNSGDCIDIEENELIGQTATVTIENSIFPDTPIRVSLNNKEYGPGAWVKPSNLTLIAKGQA